VKINRQRAISKMNFLSSERIPFIFIIDFLGENCIIEPLEKLDSTQIRFWVNGQTNVAAGRGEKKMPKRTITLDKFPINFEEYKGAFDYVQKNIFQGNSFLTNLTCETPISLNMSLLEVFEESDAKYKVWLNGSFVCFSPETFVKISKEGKISSFPMKGTIDASLPDAQKQIMSDTKELYEHTTIVDLIRNDLSKVADKVWVEKFRYLDKIETQDGGELLQVSSQISGLLPANWKDHVGEILFAMLPAGSISGAPKQKTIEIIEEAEKETYQTYDGVLATRDFYTGICGVFDGSSLDSGVMIRFIEQTPQGLVFKSGGGITSNSIAAKEYEEMIQKIYVPIVRDHQIRKPTTSQSLVP